MNDELRELLSAYLDGALSEPARKELETRLAASEDLRRELAELRAVAQAVRSLPKRAAPEGLVERVRARRVRGDAPRRDWVILPPSLRPVALALSCGVVALWIWQDVVVRAPIVIPEPPAARLTTSADAPLSQVDVSGPASGRAAGADTKASEIALGLAPAPIMGPSLVRARAQGRAIADASAGAAGAPAGPAAWSAGSMPEVARSARNEELIAGLERQKKELGIVAISPDEALASRIAAIRGSAEPGSAPTATVTGRTPRLMAFSGKPVAGSDALDAQAAAGATAGRIAPDAGLVFTDARSLASSWVLLGFPGEPPAVDFSKQRALLIKPSVSRVVSVTAERDAVVVVYRSLPTDSDTDPARDRFALLPLEPEAVRIIDATAR